MTDPTPAIPAFAVGMGVAATQDQAETRGSRDDERQGQPGVCLEGLCAEVAAEEGEEAEDLDAEEGQAEDGGGGCEARGEDCRGHDGGVGGE